MVTTYHYRLVLESPLSIFVLNQHATGVRWRGSWNVQLADLFFFFQQILGEQEKSKILFINLKLKPFKI